MSDVYHAGILRTRKYVRAYQYGNLESSRTPTVAVARVEIELWLYKVMIEILSLYENFSSAFLDKDHCVIVLPSVRKAAHCRGRVSKRS